MIYCRFFAAAALALGAAAKSETTAVIIDPILVVRVILRRARRDGRVRTAVLALADWLRSSSVR